MSTKKTRRETIEKRIVYAPQPTPVAISASIISVELGEDEEVEWQWTHYADGRSLVTGYSVVKKLKIGERGEGLVCKDEKHLRKKYEALSKP